MWTDIVSAVWNEFAGKAGLLLGMGNTFKR
ncbi:hypothetical protein HDF11_001322 [Tunturiibacter psychrotolerans]